jgi:hypothetical protein
VKRYNVRSTERHNGAIKNEYKIRYNENNWQYTSKKWTNPTKTLDSEINITTEY